MSQVVIILGAGASAEFGLPTMVSIFKDAAVRGYLEKTENLLEILRRVFWQPHKLTLKSAHKGLNIEQMLTYLKDTETEQQDTVSPSGLSQQEIDNLRRGLYVIIQRAVFEGKSSRGMHLNPLISFCSERIEHVTWASFNWDCIFEASFWYSQGPASGGRRVNPTLEVNMANWRQGTTQHLLLKLHGAINWWIVNGALTYFTWTHAGPLEEKWDDYENNRTEDLPVILEPSFYKYQDRRFEYLQPQWRVFSEHLLAAHCVVIVGYSLPDSDTYARSRILTAYRTNSQCRWVIVDPSKTVLRRYTQLLGQKGRRIKHLQMKLKDFNENINGYLAETIP